MGTKVSLAVGLMSVALLTTPAFGEQWCGLTVAPEDRCSPYERHEDYTYPRSIERDIVHRAGYEFVTTWNDGWLTEPFSSPYKRNVKVR